jgi:hypothetical protein
MRKNALDAGSRKEALSALQQFLIKYLPREQRSTAEQLVAQLLGSSPDEPDDDTDTDAPAARRRKQLAGDGLGLGFDAKPQRVISTAKAADEFARMFPDARPLARS